MMRLVLVAQVVLVSLLLGDLAAAQQHYSFEEACRNAGWTDGPCAPKQQQGQRTKPQQGQRIGCVPLVGNAFHAEKVSVPCVETSLSPVLDAEIFVELIGLQNLPKLNDLKLTIGRSSGLNNAIATFHQGSRIIILDPEWSRSGAEAYLVIGHEAGHHFCGHTLKNVELSPQHKELEADRFSGASIRRFESYHGRPFLQDALRAAERLYSPAGSRSHPPRPARIEAILLGYNSDSPCGNLASGIRGFSPQRR